MSVNKKKYILYGASFNPPHMGHFSAIRQLLESYDKVIVFPYPHKHDNGQLEKILPIKKRLKMIELFIAEFFPQISERLLLVNLTDELKQKDTKTDGFLHTYDYLKYVQTKINQKDTELHVCLGIDAQHSIEQNSFYKEEEITKEFGVFKLTEEKQITSGEIRKNLTDKKIIKSNKDEQYVSQYVGHHVSKYIIENNLYGIINKKIEYKNKVAKKPSNPATVEVAQEPTLEQANILEKNRFKPLKP